MLQGVIFNMDSVITDTEYAKDFIRCLKASGLKLAITSSSPLPVIQQAMEEFSLTDCIDAPVSGSNLPHPKPTPDLFLLAAKELGMSPSDCIVIETSETGILAANAAMIPCIGFENPNSAKQNLSRAYALLESFENADAAYLRRTHAHALGYPADITETERLLIRELSMEDFPALYTMCTAPETSVWMNEKLADFETEKEKHRAYLSNIYPLFDLALWGIYEKSTGALIGRAGFSFSEDENDAYTLGYLIDIPHRNKGFASECVPALLTYAKDSGITAIIIEIKKNNLASQHVLEHCGYPYLMGKNTNEVLFYRILLTEHN